MRQNTQGTASHISANEKRGGRKSRSWERNAKSVGRMFVKSLMLIGGANLTGCLTVYQPTGSIQQLTWDQTPNTLLFFYHYNRGTAQDVMMSTPPYRLFLERHPGQPLEPVTNTSNEDLIPYFNHLGRDYIRDHLQEFKPSETQTIPIQPRNIAYTSYQPKTNLMLVAHDSEQANGYPSKLAYSIVDIQKKTYRNLRYIDKTNGAKNPDKQVLIRWTEFDNDVLVEYTNDKLLNHALAKVDLVSSSLSNFNIFKSYPVEENVVKGLRISVNYSDLERYTADDMDHNVKVLGWETPEVVYYLEKQPNAKFIQLFKYDFKTQTEAEIAAMDLHNSYYPHLRAHEQVSIKQKKVAYLIGSGSPKDKGLRVSNLDGTNTLSFLDKVKELPVGNPIPLN